ncbi:MAG: hypothetical protein OH319_00170 [Candidatus Parvarchaeota archaeon]|nr:hypothetical protein [Candidatus Jingweiarchaeum tengchongense]MCW1310849.1 hypothetical protein [Candidatus Jingweiarchaeum tengchongense]
MSAILPSLKYSKIVTSIGHLQYIVMWYANTSIDVNENRLLYLIRDKEPLGLIVTRLNKLMKSRDVIYIFSVNEVCGSTEPEKIFIDFLKSHNKTVSEEIEIYHNEEIMFKIYKV